MSLWGILGALVALLPRPAGTGRQPISFDLASAPARPVIGYDHPGLAGNLYGFEGGSVVKVAGVYHLFVAEMAGEPFWVKMRLAHWTSPDAATWRRAATLWETSGRIDRTDERFSIWAPMPVFSDRTNRWELFYVAYQPGPAGAQGLHWNGRIWRAVSKVKGRGGIGGPYEDAGVVLSRDPGGQLWEGQQGTDSFYPYRHGKGWLAFYGGHNYDPIGPWVVGLAAAPALEGPWTRLPTGNPVAMEPRFVENPIVIRAGGRLVAIYDSMPESPGGDYVAEGLTVGYSCSPDGLTWPAGGRIAVQQPGEGNWASDVRTPLCLIDEGHGEYTMLYTAACKDRRFFGVGLARLKMRR